MVQENSNSTMEMGTSDQVLVTTKRKKKLTYLIGSIAMLVAIGIVVALVVLLSGNDAAHAERIVSTTESLVKTNPTIGLKSISTTSDDLTTTKSAPEPIYLEDIVSGVFATATFNGTWTSGNEILYQNTNGDLVLYDVDKDNASSLISNTSQILQQSSRDPQLSPDGTKVLLAYNIAPVYRYSFLARYAAVDILTGEATDIHPPALPPTEAFLQNFVWGPSGTALAFVYLNNIFYQSNLTAEPQQITTNGKLNVIYNGIPDWVYEEEVFVSSNAIWFSSDGSKLAYVTFDDSNVKVMRVPHYGVPGSVDYQYTQHHEIRYPKPGTTNPTVTVTLRDIESGVSSVYAGPVDLDQPILKTVKFVTNDTIALMWTNRVQTAIKVELCTQGQNNNCSQIFHYNEADGWIDSNPLFFNDMGDAFITILPQPVNGVLYKQIVQLSETTSGLWTTQDRTNTPHTVAKILFWAPEDIIWYEATHVNDSAEKHIYSVNSVGDVSCFTCGLRREDGGLCLYNDAVLSTNGKKISINCVGPDVPQVFIYDVNGTLIKIWDDNCETTSIVTDKELPVTIRMSVPVAAGLPEADVNIQVPRDYLNRTNVPLLVHVYGGPDTALVTKQWSIDWGSSLVSRWGIAVAQIDGRGSGLRGVSNMFSVNRRLGSVEIDDQINVTRYLHENLKWLDANRTCIWGWSYGGYAASLALARGQDVFRCAMAVAPVVDWRFYDTIYTERYMDTPQNNTLAYIHSSLLTEEVVKAFRKKRYFLIHGTADDNVHYQHAMLISSLLQKRDVFFTQMSYTDEEHGLLGVRPHLYHGLEKFLQENML